MKEFNYKGQLVRVIFIDKMPWLALTDICKILKIGGGTTRIAAKITEDNKKFEMIKNRRSSHRMIFISETGFHDIIANSNNKEFENWANNNVFNKPEPITTSEMQVFDNEEINAHIRVIDINDESWFVAADVCKALDIKNASDTLNRLDDDEKGVGSIYTPGGHQNMSIVNEYGLYGLILGSRKPEAKAFKRWITHEVLPLLRKTGKYETNNKINTQQPSVEAGIQKVGLLVRIAEHKVVPQNEQLRLLNMAVKELTGAELDLVFKKNKADESNGIQLLNSIQTMNRNLMNLPEVFGFLSKAVTKKIGGKTFYLFPVTDIANQIGVSPVKFNKFADSHGLKQGCNGAWEIVKTPQGDAREFAYVHNVTLQYFEEAK